MKFLLVLGVLGALWLPTTARAATTVVVSADANVKQGSPQKTFGTVVNISAQASATAEVRGYLTLTFTLPDGATIQSAELNLFSTVSSAIGYQVGLSNGSSWTESTLTWSNQPGVGAHVADSGPLTKGTYTSTDVSSALAGQSGTVTIGFVVTTADTAMETMASKEDPNRAHLPYLSVVTSVAPPPPLGGDPCAAADSTATAGGTLDHVVVVAMENHTYSSVFDSGTELITPYLHKLAAECSSAQGFFDSSQPSLPNYLDLTAGQHPDYMDGVSVGRITGRTDCAPYLVLTDPVKSPCYSADDNLFHQLSGDFSAYGESMPTNCRVGNQATGWLPRHVPSLYFADLATSQTDCAAVQPLPPPATIDLSRRFTFITPNGCHDMHSVTSAVDGADGCDAPVDASFNGLTYGTAFPNGCWDGANEDVCNRERGDQFLSTLIPALTSTATYQAGRTAIILWWDEDGVAGTGATEIPLVVISPFSHPDVVLPDANHFDLLATMQALLGLPPLADQATTPYGWVSGPAEVNDPGPGSSSGTDLRSYFGLN